MSISCENTIYYVYLIERLLLQKVNLKRQFVKWRGSIPFSRCQSKRRYESSRTFEKGPKTWGAGFSLPGFGVSPNPGRGRLPSALPPAKRVWGAQQAPQKFGMTHI
jgi:hypothetical protein